MEYGESHVSNETSIGWRLHDVVVGLLAGGVGGFVAGLFATRLVHSIFVPTALAAVGAIVGFALLRGERARRVGRDPWGPLTIAAWVVLVLGSAFLVLLFDAIANLE